MNAFAKLESLLKPNPFDALAALIRSDASVSTAQHNAMEAAAHGHSILGIPEDVGAEFVAQDMRNDADRWITVHGNGGSSPALIGEDGTVKGGMGGKFNGLNIKDTNNKAVQERAEKRSRGSVEHGKQAAKAEGATAPKLGKQTDLAQSIKELGGVHLSHAKDTLGDNPQGAWKFAFSNNGKGMDDLATQLKDKGYDIDTDAHDGGVQQLKDMIRDHANGERVGLHHEIENAAQHEAYQQARDALADNAAQRGIVVSKGMTDAAINHAIQHHDAREEAESLGIKVTAKMRPSEIYEKVEAEIAHREGLARTEREDRLNSQRQRDIDNERDNNARLANSDNFRFGENSEEAQNPTAGLFNQHEEPATGGETNAETAARNSPKKYTTESFLNATKHGNEKDKSFILVEKGTGHAVSSPIDNTPYNIETLNKKGLNHEKYEAISESEQMLRAAAEIKNGSRLYDGPSAETAARHEGSEAQSKSSIDLGDYSDWSKQLAQNYSREELASKIKALEDKRDRLANSHLSAIEKTSSMTGNSQARAQSSNSLSGNYESLMAHKHALELHDAGHGISAEKEIDNAIAKEAANNIALRDSLLKEHSDLVAKAKAMGVKGIRENMASNVIKSKMIAHEGENLAQAPKVGAQPQRANEEADKQEPHLFSKPKTVNRETISGTHIYSKAGEESRPPKPFDHGELNLPLSKRAGNLDKHLAEQARLSKIYDRENKPIKTESEINAKKIKLEEKTNRSAIAATNKQELEVRAKSTFDTHGEALAQKMATQPDRQFGSDVNNYREHLKELSQIKPREFLKLADKNIINSDAVNAAPKREYISHQDVGDVSVGAYNGAKERRERAHERLKHIRANPRSYNAIDKLKAVGAHKDALLNENQSREAIEKAANRLGKTTFTEKQHAARDTERENNAAQLASVRAEMAKHEVANVAPKREYTPEHRAAQKAAQSAVNSLPQHAIEHHAKEQGVSAEQAKKDLLLEANQNAAKSAETVAKLSQVEKPQAKPATPAEPPKPKEFAPSNVDTTGHEKPHSIGGGGYGSAMRAATQAAHEEFGTEAPRSNTDFTIAHETENAYAIHNPDYAPQPSGYYGQHRAAKGESFNNQKYIWIPKSHASVSGEGENRQIATLSPWIAKEKGINTHESNARDAETAKTQSAIENSANERYQSLINHAKQNGIKGARVGMRTSTILDKYKEAGIEPPASHNDKLPQEQKIGEVKYHAIPSGGKGAILNVPFANKDEVKAHGARWSPDLKKWYMPEGKELPEALHKFRADSARSDAAYSADECALLDKEWTESPIDRLARLIKQSSDPFAKLVRLMR